MGVEHPGPAGISHRFNQLIHRRDAEKQRFSAGTQGVALRLGAIAAAVGIGVAAALILLGAREGIARLYTGEGDVALLSATLLLFVAVYIIVDSAQATAMGALRGYKDTRGPMLIAFGGYWLFALPLGTALGLGWVPSVGALGVYGFWIGLSLGLALVAGGLLWRLYRRSRRATLPA